jgi:Leu/Phe-tRNA-protein transferase
MELLSILRASNYSMDGGRLMTALEAKRAADNFNQDLFKRTMEKVTEYLNKKIEEAAYQGNYEFYLKSNDELLITTIGEREVFELFKNIDLQKELKKQFRVDGFLVSFDKGYERAYVIVSWREPY